ERRSASGTYVAGKREICRGVDLIFTDRAKRADSFGARLLGMLREALELAGIEHRTRWAGEVARPDDVPRDRYPIIWEQAQLAEALAAERRFVLILEDRPVR